MYFVQCFDYIGKVKANSFNDPAFTKQVKRARSRRLAMALTDLVGLKVKGIITEAEYRQKKRKLLGF